MGDTGNDERVERAGEQSVQRRVRNEWYERVRSGPQQQRGKSSAERAGNEERETSERVGEVRRCDPPKHAARVQHGEDVEGGARGDALVGGVGDEVAEGGEET